jgi:hypothetical protein
VSLFVSLKLDTDLQAHVRQRVLELSPGTLKVLDMQPVQEEEHSFLRNRVLGSDNTVDQYLDSVPGSDAHHRGVWKEMPLVLRLSHCLDSIAVYVASCYIPAMLT